MAGGSRPYDRREIVPDKDGNPCGMASDKNLRGPPPGRSPPSASIEGPVLSPCPLLPSPKDQPNPGPPVRPSVHHSPQARHSRESGNPVMASWSITTPPCLAGRQALRGSRQIKGAARGFSDREERAVRLHTADESGLLRAGLVRHSCASMPSNASIGGQESRQADSVLIRKKPCTPLVTAFHGCFQAVYRSFRSRSQ